MSKKFNTSEKDENKTETITTKRTIPTRKRRITRRISLNKSKHL